MISLKRVDRSLHKGPVTPLRQKPHNCSRLGVRRTLLVRQKNEQALSCRPRKSAISYTPTASTMSSLQNIDFSQPIDLSDKTEKEIQAILKELQHRYTQSMVSNAQLDNEKQALYYQVDDVQDKLVEETERKQFAASELKAWTRSIEEEKRKQLLLDIQISRMKDMISERDQLIKDNKMVMVTLDSSNVEEGGRSNEVDDRLQQIIQGTSSSLTLDERVKGLIKENETVKSELDESKQELVKIREENATRCRQPSKSQSTCTAAEVAQFEREQNFILAKHKQDVIQANLKIDSLENQLLRLEAQMHRHREVYEDTEKNKQRLKSDNRRINRQVEESVRRKEELQRECEHLELRIEKVKSVRDKALQADKF